MIKKIKGFGNGGRYKDRTCDPYDVNARPHPYPIDLSSRIGTNAPFSFLIDSRQSGAKQGRGVPLPLPVPPAPLGRG
jgi:hypothetical protein